MYFRAIFIKLLILLLLLFAALGLRMGGCAIPVCECTLHSQPTRWLQSRFIFRSKLQFRTRNEKGGRDARKQSPSMCDKFLIS